MSEQNKLLGWLAGSALTIFVGVWAAAIWAADQWLVTEAELSAVLLQQEHRTIRGEIQDLEFQRLKASAEEKALIDAFIQDKEYELNVIEQQLGDGG